MNSNDFKNEIIGNLTISIPFLLTTSTGNEAYNLFESTPELEGIVILDNGIPAGIIMRNFFYQKLAERYGFSLYMKRSVTLLMDASPMIVDYNSKISKVGISAMSRPQSKLYDYVLVCKDNNYEGAVSIRMFLVELSKKSEEKLELLEEQHKTLIASHEHEKALLSEISRSNEQLAYKSSSVKNLLDNAGQGFLSFGDRYEISEEYSAECIKILGNRISGSNYLSLIEAIFPKDSVDMQKLALKSYFNSQSEIKDDAYLHLLPKECTIDYKTIRLEYKRVLLFGEKQIMVVLTDITEKVKLERIMEKERKNVRLIIKAVTSANELRQMISDITEYFKSVYDVFSCTNDMEEIIKDIFRTVHTFKGEFAQFGLYNSAEKLHIIENRLQDKTFYSEKCLRDYFDGINANDITSEDINIIENALGKDYLNDSGSVTISEIHIKQVEEEAKKLSNADELVVLINKLRRRNIKDILAQYEDYTAYVFERLGKPAGNFIVTGDDVWITTEDYSHVLKSLNHIFRNVCDHGIEMPDDRVVAGKPEQGTCTCFVKIENDMLNLTISDDGRGIDSETIKNIALEKGIVNIEELENMRESEILNLIFSHGFSTKDEVTALSGRGVGMNAVKDAVERAGGCIEVKTSAGVGTKFYLSIPLVMDKKEKVQI